MSTQNTHLRLFRFFSESENEQYLENNLSRAFAICLQREPALLLSFLTEILSPSDQEKVLSIPPNEERIQVDIQQRVKDLEVASISTIYAVAMSGEDFDEAAYEAIEARTATDNPITDLIISIRDILIVIEVKRTLENCLAQLKEQVLKIRENVESADLQIHFRSFCWKTATKLFQNIDHLYQLTGHPHSYSGELYNLIATRFNEWLDTRPFKYIDYKFSAPDSEKWIAGERLKQAMQQVQQQVEQYETSFSNNRNSWQVPFNWASEVLAGMQANEGKSPALVLSMYPANTKGQGWSIFNREDPIGWMNQRTLTVAGDQHTIEYGLHIKFAGFQGRYISGLFIYDAGTINHLKESLYTDENFRRSGKYKRHQWDEFAAFFDQVFPPEYNWKSKMHWEDKFVKSGRNEFSVSFGFEVYVYIPYSKLQELDQSQDDLAAVGAYLEEAVTALGGLI